MPKMWPSDPDPGLNSMKQVVFYGIVATALFGLVMFGFVY